MKKILFIDDCPDTMELFRESVEIDLEEKGEDVKCVGINDLPGIKEHILSGEYDLIVSDLNLEGTDFMNFCIENDCIPKVPLIIVTGEYTKLSFFEHENFNVMYKPLDVEMLFREVRERLF